MKRILITGTTSGLGLETAKALVKEGHHIIMACRNMDKGRLIQEQLLKNCPNAQVDLLHLDLSSFESIIAFSKIFNEKYTYLDVLINNAGVFCDSHQTTVEGYEMTMGVNYLGQYLLTQLLIDVLKVPSDARIVNVSSKAGFFGKLNIRLDWMKNHPHGFKAYSASKLAQLMFTINLSEKLKDDHITVNAAHPGSVATNIWKGSSLMMKMMAPIAKMRYSTPEVACKTSVYLAVASELDGITGQLYQKEHQVMKFNQRVCDKETQKRLSEHTENILKDYLS